MRSAAQARWRVLAGLRRRRLLQQQREAAEQPATPAQGDSAAAGGADYSYAFGEPLFHSAPAAGAQLAPTPEALAVLEGLQQGRELEAALTEGRGFTPTGPNLASLMDALAAAKTPAALGLRALMWAVRHPAFTPASPLLPARVAGLLPAPRPTSVERFLSDLHQFWQHPQLPLPPDLLHPLLSLYCSASPSIELPLEALNLALRKGASPSTPLLNLVLRTSLDPHRRLDTARWLFRRMQAISLPPDVVSYNILISGCCSSPGGAQQLQEAFDLFREMGLHGVAPNDATYGSLIAGALQAGQLDTALQLLREMKYNGLRPAPQTYAGVMEGFCRKGDHQTTRALLTEMRAEGLSLDERTFEGLVIAICHATGVHEAEARKLLDVGSMNYGM